jgi:hypothetical protein
MKIKLYSPYNHFKNHIPQEGEEYIECYNDAYAMKMRPINRDNSIALLIEPRPLQPSVYEFVEQHYDRFKYIFTHDSILLSKLPNAKPIIWGGVWCTTDIQKEFEHPISMVASWKEQAPVRIQRKQLAFELKGKIDTYGTFDGGEKVEPEVVYAKYPFSVVIENHIDDWWITEKICNCFACKTVPIYYGAKNIGALFDIDGIIVCHSIDEVRTAVDYVLSHAEQEYRIRNYSINKNYFTVYKYRDFEEWFYDQYGELLDNMGDK